VQVPFDTVGVIRHIDISDDWTQIIVDWEQDGKTQKLVFPMNAADGPRNNHMRTYFEKGELSRPPREPKSIPEPAAEPAPETPQADPSLDRFGGTHPQEEVMLGPLKVACGCDPVFHRPVWPAVHTSVNACLRCGAVTVTRQVGDDGRFTGDAWTAYWTVPTPQAIADWLGHFPRVAVDHAGARWRWPMSAEHARYPILVYPADTRVSDRAELDALEARASLMIRPISSWQVGMSWIRPATMPQLQAPASMSPIDHHLRIDARATWSWMSAIVSATALFAFDLDQAAPSC
jgi:hypothetical protein